MIRLALAVGFLAVFGFVAITWSAAILNYFKKKDNTNQTKQEEK